MEFSGHWLRPVYHSVYQGGSRNWVTTSAVEGIAPTTLFLAPLRFYAEATPVDEAVHAGLLLTRILFGIVHVSDKHTRSGASASACGRRVEQTLWPASFYCPLASATASLSPASRDSRTPGPPPLGEMNSTPAIRRAPDRRCMVAPPVLKPPQLQFEPRYGAAQRCGWPSPAATTPATIALRKLRLSWGGPA